MVLASHLYGYRILRSKQPMMFFVFKKMSTNLGYLTFLFFLLMSFSCNTSATLRGGESSPECEILPHVSSLCKFQKKNEKFQKKNEKLTAKLDVEPIPNPTSNLTSNPMPNPMPNLTPNLTPNPTPSPTPTPTPAMADTMTVCAIDGPCTGNATCTIGEECCCRSCFPSIQCNCRYGKFMCHATESCMLARTCTNSITCFSGRMCVNGRCCLGV